MDIYFIVTKSRHFCLVGIDPIVRFNLVYVHFTITFVIFTASISNNLIESVDKFVIKFYHYFQVFYGFVHDESKITKYSFDLHPTFFYNIEQFKISLFWVFNHFLNVQYLNDKLIFHQILHKEKHNKSFILYGNNIHELHNVQHTQVSK